MSPLAPNPNPMVGTMEPPSQEPFIGLLVKWDPPTYRLALKPGDHIAVFADPAHPDSAARWVVVSIDARYIHLKCDCTVPGCTRTATYKASYKGVHPSRER